MLAAEQKQETRDGAGERPPPIGTTDTQATELICLAISLRSHCNHIMRLNMRPLSSLNSELLFAFSFRKKTQAKGASAFRVFCFCVRCPVRPRRRGAYCATLRQRTREQCTEAAASYSVSVAGHQHQSGNGNEMRGSICPESAHLSPFGARLLRSRGEFANQSQGTKTLSWPRQETFKLCFCLKS